MGANHSTENVQDRPQPFRNPNMALEINEKEESKTNKITDVKKSFTVVLFGETAHGKSYFGNELLNYGRNSTRVEHFTEGASRNSMYSQFSCTSSSIKKDSPNFFGKKLSVIDTVGFYDNRGISGSDVLRQIMSCLQSMPDGFDLAIFCYSAHHPRFNDSSFEILRRWKKILGQNVFKNTIILLTQCNTLSPEKIKALNPQKKGLQKLLLKQFEQHEFQFFCAGLKDTQGNDPIYQQLAEKMNQITPYKPTLASFDWKNPKDYEKFLAVPEWRNMIEQIISDQEKVLTNFKEKALNPLKEDKIQLIRKGLKDLTNFLEGVTKIINDSLSEKSTSQTKTDSTPNICKQMRKILTNYIDKSEYPEFLITASDQLEILESEPKITMEMLEQYMKDISIIYLYETTTLEQNTDIPNIITNIERELELFNELKEGLKEGIIQRKLFVLVQQQEFRKKLDEYMKEPDDYNSGKKTEHRSLWNDINSVIEEFSTTHKNYRVKTNYARDLLDFVTKNIEKKIIKSLQIMANDHLKRFTEHFSIKFPEVETFGNLSLGGVCMMDGIFIYVGAIFSGTTGFAFALACFVGGLGFLLSISLFWLVLLRDDKEIEKEVAENIHKQFNKHYILNPLLEYAEHRLELLLLDYVNGLATKS